MLLDAPMAACSQLHPWRCGGQLGATWSRRARIRLQFGADLAGGEDAERNAAVARLRRAFLADSASKAADAADAVASSGAAPAEVPPFNSSADRHNAQRLGVLTDLPLCRWPFVLLPFSQRELNVFEPTYTLMFEQLLATERPWHYVHLYLPGGSKNLGDPQYALQPWNRSAVAPSSGTLMRVVEAQRMPDSRLRLVVQGLSRWAG